MYVIGLTGGIGSGKTAVSQIFESLGVAVVDADQAQRVVVEKGSQALQRIAEHFGPESLLPDGTLNRPALRRIVFSQPEERGWLEKLLHPLIFQELQRQLREAQGPYCLLVSPLLVETGQNRLTRRILVVDAPDEVRIARTVARDQTTADQIRAIMAAQVESGKRLSYADDVLVNDSDVESLGKQVRDLHEKYLKLAQTDTSGTQTEDGSKNV